MKRLDRVEKRRTRVNAGELFSWRRLQSLEFPQMNNTAKRETAFRFAAAVYNSNQHLITLVVPPRNSVGPVAPPVSAASTPAGPVASSVSALAFVFTPASVFSTCVSRFFSLNSSRLSRAFSPRARLGRFFSIERRYEWQGKGKLRAIVTLTRPRRAAASKPISYNLADDGANGDPGPSTRNKRRSRTVQDTDDEE